MIIKGEKSVPAFPQDRAPGSDPRAKREGGSWETHNTPVNLRNVLVWVLSILLLAGCGRGAGVGVEDTGKVGEISVSVTLGDQPVSGALVQLLDQSQSPVGEQKTDENGIAVFKGVPAAGGYVAIATLEGTTGQANDLRVAGGSTMAKIVLSENSGPVGLIVGTVKLAGADRALPGVSIEVAGRKAQTDANGQFKLEGVPAGPATVKASIGGYTSVSQAVVVKPGSSNAVALELQPLATGPKAGHTIVTTTTKVIELDAWRNQVGVFAASQAWSALFLADGGVLVADAGADKVQEFSDSAAKKTAFTGRAIWQLGIGGVSAPRGATKTKSGNIVVADTGHNRILEIDGSNKIVWEFKTNLSAPHWAERLPSGNTLVVDTGNNRVIEVKPDGSLAWGLGDGSTDTLNNPTTAQRLPNGNTLVCDAGNGRVMEVNAQNQLVWMAPGRGGDVGTLANPNSARRLANGNTLIADTDNDRVIEVDAGGSLVWKATVAQPVFADRF